METMNCKEAAAFLKITEGTLRNWLATKRLPFHKIGRRVIFFREELESLILSPGKAAMTSDDKPTKKPGKFVADACLTVEIDYLRAPTIEPAAIISGLPGGDNVTMTAEQLRVMVEPLNKAVDAMMSGKKINVRQRYKVSNYADTSKARRTSDGV
jgi:excisionase family DNA binding protein